MTVSVVSGSADRVIDSDINRKYRNIKAEPSLSMGSFTGEFRTFQLRTVSLLAYQQYSVINIRS